MEPIALFGIQFTMSLVAYALIAFWYVVPRLANLPREVALVPLLWVHPFRIVGGTSLGPRPPDAGGPKEVRGMIGHGGPATAAPAALGLLARPARFWGAG